MRQRLRPFAGIGRSPRYAVAVGVPYRDNLSAGQARPPSRSVSKLAMRASTFPLSDPFRTRSHGLASRARLSITGGVNQYLQLIRRILDTGAVQNDRTGTGTLSVFGHQMRFDLSEGFPVLTTKKLHLRSIIIELLWFLRGDTNIAWLKENKVSIWDEWADENGDLGPVYGKQWRDWIGPDGSHIDQIAALIDMINGNPGSRRQIVSAWN